MRLLRIIMLLLIGCATVAADQPKNKKTKAKPEQKPVSFWMQKKLEYTQEILRGLAMGDLETVAEKSDQMHRLSKIEGWIRSRKPGYSAQLQAFEFANAEILRNARADNLEGTAIAFQQLTISCVSCHKMLRNVD